MQSPGSGGVSDSGASPISITLPAADVNGRRARPTDGRGPPRALVGRRRHGAVVAAIIFATSMGVLPREVARSRIMAVPEASKPEACRRATPASTGRCTVRTPAARSCGPAAAFRQGHLRLGVLALDLLVPAAASAVLVGICWTVIVGCATVMPLLEIGERLLGGDLHRLRELRHRHQLRVRDRGSLDVVDHEFLISSPTSMTVPNGGRPVIETARKGACHRRGGQFTLHADTGLQLHLR